MNGSQGPGNLLKFHVVFVNDTEAVAFIKFSVGFVTKQNKTKQKITKNLPKNPHTHFFKK